MSDDIIARTVKDFCRVYGVGKSKAYELMAQGKLDVRKAGRRTLIVEESAKAWFNAAAKPPISVPMHETPLTANESELPRKLQITKSLRRKAFRTMTNDSGR